MLIRYFFTYSRGAPKSISKPFSIRPVFPFCVSSCFLWPFLTYLTVTKSLWFISTWTRLSRARALESFDGGTGTGPPPRGVSPLEAYSAAGAVR